MTIGIGVLASEGEGIKPNRVVLVADTKGSFGDSLSMNRLHKVFLLPEKRVYAVGAGHIDKASELFKAVSDASNFVHGGTTRYGSIVESVTAGADLYKRVRFKLDVLPRFARIPQSLPDMFTDKELGPDLLKEWREYDFGCQMLVGAFNDAGQAYLLCIEGDGKIHNFTFPGFAAIGSGFDNAMFWLSYRNHNLGFSLRRAAYHAFEAKLMAESSPYVNEKLDVLVAKGSKWALTSDTHPLKGNDQSLAIGAEELRGMFAQYGPKSTDELK